MNALLARLLPEPYRSIVSLLISVGPELAKAVHELVKALKGGDDVAARRAYEAARRAAFIARQK